MLYFYYSGCNRTEQKICIPAKKNKKSARESEKDICELVHCLLYCTEVGLFLVTKIQLRLLHGLFLDPCHPWTFVTTAAWRVLCLRVEETFFFNPVLFVM
jgi:hypothetical protein